MRDNLSKVVNDVDSLIPQSEAEFEEVQKFGLYPAEQCQPFVTKQGTPFYQLRDNGKLEYQLPSDMHLSENLY
jgi:hypothetical protein